MPYERKFSKYWQTDHQVPEVHFLGFLLTLYLFPFANVLCLFFLLRSIPSIDTPNHLPIIKPFPLFLSFFLSSPSLSHFLSILSWPQPCTSILVYPCSASSTLPPTERNKTNQPRSSKNRWTTLMHCFRQVLWKYNENWSVEKRGLMQTVPVLHLHFSWTVLIYDGQREEQR